MTLSAILLFCAAYLIAAAVPGPGIAALVARVLAGGRGTPAFIAGFVVGDLIWFSIAATGLVLVAQTFVTLFLLIKCAGAAYLLYLAYKLWTAPVTATTVAAAADESPVKLFLAGLALTLGNPKVILFFMALLPTVVDLTKLSVLGFIEIALIICIGLTAVLTAYALTAAKARLLFTSIRAIKLLNKSTGAVMASAAAVVATR